MTRSDETSHGLSATAELLVLEHISILTLLGQIARAGWVCFDAK